MRCSRAALLALVLFVPGCINDMCTRNTDCQVGLICMSAQCVKAPVKTSDGGVDDGGTSSVDAGAIDAAASFDAMSPNPDASIDAGSSGNPVDAGVDASLPDASME